jgi:hypothetical protein
MSSRDCRTTGLIWALAACMMFGCTTKFHPAVDQFNAGNCQTAIDKAHAIAPTKSVQNRGSKAKAEHERDHLWVTLEKARMLSCCGELGEATSLFYYVKGESDFYRYIESRYRMNPLDVGAWDASQFAGDAGQAIMGADQLPYEVQPFEMTLCNAYGALTCLLLDEPGAAEFARAAGEIQDDEGKDLEAIGYLENMPSPASRIDSRVQSALPPNSSSSYSTNMIFSLGDFSRAKADLNAAIESGRSAHAADPRLAFASAVAWASYHRDGDRALAAEAIRGLETMSRAPALTSAMRSIHAGDAGDFVMVLVDAGRGPKRNYFNVSFPVIIPKVGSAYFRAVYPVLQFRPDGRPTDIRVTGGSGPVAAELLTSIDAVAARDFKRREAALWWTPTIRAALRVVGAIVAQAADRDKEGWGAIVGVTTAIMAAAEQPDLRNWSTLPGAQYAAIVPRPTNGMLRIELAAASGANALTVGVPEGSSVVYVCAQTPDKVSSHTGRLRRPAGR